MINLSLTSLRISSFKPEMAKDSRKSSLTFAPEAGTQRLRNVINKNVSEEEIDKIAGRNRGFLFRKTIYKVKK